MYSIVRLLIEHHKKLFINSMHIYCRFLTHSHKSHDTQNSLKLQKCSISNVLYVPTYNICRYIRSEGSCWVRFVASSSVWMKAFSGMAPFWHILISMMVSLFRNTVRHTPLCTCTYIRTSITHKCIPTQA